MVSMKELLQDAQQQGYGIGAFNITSTTYIDAILDAAQEKKSPVIIAISEGHVRKGYVSLEATVKYIQQRIKGLSIPIALHFDHGETIEMIEKAINCGFTSVMIDRSHETLEQNIKDTRIIVDICKNKNISIEGELGMIGGKEGDGHINIADSSLFTDPNIALKYIQETNVDALAVAIGNVHGRYSGKPNLDFYRLQAIKNQVAIPLVLHGGSGISEDDFRKLIQNGIYKINFYSGNAQVAYSSCKEFMDTDPLQRGVDIGELFKTVYKSVKENVMLQMDIFMSSNKG